MNRRACLRALVAGAILVAPGTAGGQQQAAMPKVGVLFFGSPDRDITQRGKAFREGMAALGWIEGRTVAYELRFAAGSQQRMDTMARELAAARVDVLVCVGTNATRAARDASGTIPIVMAGVRDPVATGFVGNLARPGGTITGISLLSTDTVAKQIELLREIQPRLARLAVLMRERDASYSRVLADLRAMPRLGVELHDLVVAAPDELPAVFEKMAAANAEAVLVLPNPDMDEMRARIAELALGAKIASIGAFREYAESGFLLSYAASLPEAHRRTALYVDKILKGAKPGDLPVEQPTKFDVAVNLRTAKALSLVIPQSVLARADEVIE